MGVRDAGGGRFDATRRAFLAALAAAPVAGQKPGAATAKGRSFESEARRYADGATEFQVLRLTDPKFTSMLPDCHGRAVAQRNSNLLYSSDRTGSLQAFRMELKGFANRQLTEVEHLDAATLSWIAGDRQFCFFDGPDLHLSTTASLRDRVIYSHPEGWKRGTGFAVAEDGRHAFFVETDGAKWRLRMLAFAQASVSTVVESGEEIGDPMPRPRRAGILYRKGAELWLVGYDGAGRRGLKPQEGTTGPAFWSPDGRTIIYLHFPTEKGQLNTLRELTADTGEDKLIAKTSQFVNFGMNGDATVFVGASGSKASPHVLLLLRVTRRELTLCEHRASNPTSVAPVFTPNSQRIVFQSDLHGKPALYTMVVDKLVEQTESDETA